MFIFTNLFGVLTRQDSSPTPMSVTLSGIHGNGRKRHLSLVARDLNRKASLIEITPPDRNHPVLRHFVSNTT